MLRKFKQIEIIIRISICYERNSACTLDVFSKSGKVAIHNCKILYWAYCCNYAVNTYSIQNKTVFEITQTTMLNTASHNYPSYHPRYLTHLHLNPRHAVAQLVQALHYKPEGRGLHSRWCHKNPSGRAMVLGSIQSLTEINTRNISWKMKPAGA